MIKIKICKEGEVINIFKYSLEEIQKGINIPFRVKNSNGDILINSLGDIVLETIETTIETKDSNLIVETSIEFKKCLGLLKYCIEQKIKDRVRSKNEIIEDILTAKSSYDLALEYQEIIIPNNIILIYQSINKGEVLSIVLKKNINRKEIVISLDKYIVILVNDENKDKYLEGITKLINSEDNKNYYTSYGKILGLSDLKDKFDYLIENINLSIRYKLKVKTYNENELILERAVDSISESEKKKIYNDYNKILSKLDEDLIKTIEVFLKEGLRVSDSSERLYIHRNTLFYRIDKIKKIVNYDITNFNEATEFKIIFNIWKANKNQYIS